MEINTEKKIKTIIEALLFSTSAPLSLLKIKKITDTFSQESTKYLRKLIQELKEEYDIQNRAFVLEEIAGGYVLITREDLYPYLQALHQNRVREKLSKASLEVLAIIAYKQPITRPQIEIIRGVDCSGPLNLLIDRNLIKILGRADIPGKPLLYGVTDAFLKYFGLKHLKELPKVD